MLSNDMGGLDWAALPLAVAHFGISDVAGLVRRLVTIKTHRPPGKE